MKVTGFNLYDSVWQTAYTMGRELPPRWEDLNAADRYYWDSVADRIQPVAPSTRAQLLTLAERKSA